MARWQLPDWLSAKALGTDGGQELADGSLMPAGIHLRWDFDSDIGFPRGGFDIYRRPHDAGQKLCGMFFPVPDGGINLLGPGIIPDYVTVTTTGDHSFVNGCNQPIPDTAIYLPGAQTLRIDLLVPVRHVEITLDASSPDPVVADAYWNSSSGEVLVDRALARQTAAGNWEINLYADRIDRVLVRGRDMVVCMACFVLAATGLDLNWGQLPINADVIHLPITNAKWPGTHPHQPDDLAEADARLPAGLPVEKRTSYLDGFETELHPILDSLVETRPQQRCYVDEPGASDGDDQQTAPTRMRWQALQLLKLAALDPNLARILGLYWHDADAQAGQLYDYLIVGHWEDRPFPGKRFDFSQLTVGSRYTAFLDYDGLRFTSPNPITVVEETWDGISGTALEVTPLMPGGPVIIALPSPCESVTLYLKADADNALKVTAYAGTQEVDDRDVQAGEQIVNFVDSRGITRLQLEVSTRVVVVELVVRLKAETIGDLNYVTFRHQVASPRRVPETSLGAAVVLPGQTRFDPEGGIQEGQAVGLRWQPFDVGEGYLAGDAPIFYLVQRAARGDGETPGPFADLVVLNEDAPLLLSSRILEDRSEAENGRILPCYIDRFLADGWYSYRVQGIDLFGRLSGWGDPQTVQVRDQVAPPPPIGVSATYLDPDDRYLPPEDATHAPGVKVVWEWPGIQHVQAPDVATDPGQFRVYAQRGELNTLQGQVLAVTSNVTTSILETDATWEGDADALDREWVRVSGVYFPVSSHTRGRNITITVDNLTQPDQIPEPGPFTLTYSPYGVPPPQVELPHGGLPTPTPFRLASRPHNEYWTDYREPLSWERRVHVGPAAPTPVVAGHITSVTGGSTPDEIIIATDQRLADSDGDLTPGVLFSRGLMYQVRSHALDDPENPDDRLTLWTSTRPVPSDPPEAEQVTVQPAPGDAFVYYPGRRYVVYLPQLALPPQAVSGTAVAHIGVTAADGKPYAVDHPIWSTEERGALGGQPGNEGPVSAPSRIIAVERTVLPGIDGVPIASDTPIFARPADYFGEARYTLTWTAMADASEYAVCRCTSGALFDQDSKLRREEKGYYADPNVDRFGDDPAFDAWLAEYYPDLTRDTLSTEAWRDWAAHFYPAQSDARIQEIANLPGNEAAFRRVNAETVTATAYMDSFDGTGQGFYLYRVRAINAAGQLGNWSATFPPVHIYDVTPPAAPTLTSIIGGERSVTLTWRANAERDLAAYHLWRADDAATLANTRRLPPLAVITPTADAVLESHMDPDLAAGTPYHYCIAAVDANGNMSQPSAVGVARAVDTSTPAPPEWVAARWDRTEAGILLRWTPAEETHEALVQRSSPESGGLWLSITGWLPPGTNRYADLSAMANETNIYRLRVRSASGNLNASYNEIEVSPPAGDAE